MQVKLENPTEFTKAIELISELVTEVKIKFSDYGLSISAMDPANVSMVGFKIPKTSFKEFETGLGAIGINLGSFKRILKRAGSASTLILKKQDNQLNIEVDDRIKRKFSLGLIDIDSEDIDFASKTSNMEFSSKVEVNSIDFISSIEDCMVVSDSCAFIIKENNFIVEARGISSARIEFSGDEAKISGEEARAKYSLEYLSKFIKAAKMTEKTKIEFAEDHPMKMDFKTQKFELSFVLAPRVETD